MQLLATILFFIVFILLFFACILYIGSTLYTYVKESRKPKKEEDKEED